MKISVLTICTLAIALMGLSVKPASAKVVTVEVTGIVNSVDTQGEFALDGSISVGSTMTGMCSYDTGSDDLEADQHIGKYSMISVSMDIGNYTFYQ